MPSAWASITQTHRRLESWVHTAMCTVQRQHSTSCTEPAASILLFVSSKRDMFFPGGPSLEELAAQFRTHPTTLEGEHLEVMGRCATGQEASFVQSVRALLDDEHKDVVVRFPKHH